MVSDTPQQLFFNRVITYPNKTIDIRMGIASEDENKFSTA
jgi:hypothetical protein